MFVFEGAHLPANDMNDVSSVLRDTRIFVNHSGAQIRTRECLTGVGLLLPEEYASGRCPPLYGWLISYLSMRGMGLCAAGEGQCSWTVLYQATDNCRDLGW